MVTAGSGLEVHLRIGHHCLRRRPMAGTAFLGVGSAYGGGAAVPNVFAQSRPVFADECWIASLPFPLLAPVLLRGLRAICRMHLQAAGPRPFAVVFSISKGVFRPRGRLNCVHCFFLVMSRVGRFIGHMPGCATKHLCIVVCSVCSRQLVGTACFCTECLLGRCCCG